MGDLLERIQASEEELEAQLQTIHACEVNGKNDSQMFIFSHFFPPFRYVIYCMWFVSIYMLALVCPHV
jgi:hypothetical protein